MQDLFHFYVVDKMRSALEHFKEGLSTLKVLSHEKASPFVARVFLP